MQYTTTFFIKCQQLFVIIKSLMSVYVCGERVISWKEVRTQELEVKLKAEPDFTRQLIHGF